MSEENRKNTGFEIARKFKDLAKDANGTVTENIYYTSIARALEDAEALRLFEVNSGNRYWDVLVKSFLRVLNTKGKPSEVIRYYSQPYVYVVLREFQNFLEEDHFRVGSKENDLKLKEQLPILISSVRDGKYINFKEDRFVTRIDIDKRIDEYERKYQTPLREHRERKLLRDEVYSILDVERASFNELKEHVASKMAYINNEIDKTKQDLSTVKTDSSFLVGEYGLEKLERSLTTEKRRATSFRYVMMIMVILSVCYLVYTLSSISSQGFYGLNFKIGIASGTEVVKSNAVEFNYYVLNTIKTALVNIVVLSCSLYFYKVALMDERKVTGFLRELEFKAAITSFQNSNISRVKDMDGDVNESMKRYEEFLYARWTDISIDNTTRNDNEESYDKGYLSAIKKIVDR